MKKVLFLSLFVASAVLAACLLPRNNSSLEGLAKANVEALASVPVEVKCAAGGMGADECGKTYDGDDGNIHSCYVHCSFEYYACCYDDSCICIHVLDFNE